MLRDRERIEGIRHPATRNGEYFQRTGEVEQLDIVEEEDHGRSDHDWESLAIGLESMHKVIPIATKPSRA